jgi:hypothetical protein
MGTICTVCIHQDTKNDNDSTLKTIRETNGDKECKIHIIYTCKILNLDDNENASNKNLSQKIVQSRSGIYQEVLEDKEIQYEDVSKGSIITEVEFMREVSNLGIQYDPFIKIKYPNDIMIVEEYNSNTPEKYAVKISDNLIVFGDYNPEGCLIGEGMQLDIPNQILYRGYFKNNEIIYGYIYRSDKSFYEGYISSSLPNGQGYYISPTQDIYKGNWVNGRVEGKAIIEFQDKSIYEGRVNSKVEFDGEGKLTWNENSYYEGFFINNKLDGYGVFKDKDFIYEGEFKDSRYHGKGKAEWIESPNEVYSFNGQYEFGKKKRGTYIFKHFELEVNFKDNYPHGAAKLTDRIATKTYQLFFKNGQMINQIIELPIDKNFFLNIKAEASNLKNHITCVSTYNQLLKGMKNMINIQ